MFSSKRSNLASHLIASAKEVMIMTALVCLIDRIGKNYRASFLFKNTMSNFSLVMPL